tara:strand:+ start:683 stop:946 length:264 start_codon:yes stop_codon:yes gene_type:complete
MATAKKESIVVSEKVSKVSNGKSVQIMKVVKTDGSSADAGKAVLELQKRKVSYFEVYDEETKVKTIYTKMLGGKNYTKKVIDTSKKQ